MRLLYEMKICRDKPVETVQTDATSSSETIHSVLGSYALIVSLYTLCFSVAVKCSDTSSCDISRHTFESEECSLLKLKLTLLSENIG